MEISSFGRARGITGPGRQLPMLKRSVTISGHRTSVSLEEEFWQAFNEIAERRNKPLAELVREIDRKRADRGLSSAIRIYVLNYYKAGE